MILAAHDANFSIPSQVKSHAQKFQKHHSARKLELEHLHDAYVREELRKAQAQEMLLQKAQAGASKATKRKVNTKAKVSSNTPSPSKKSKPSPGQTSQVLPASPTKPDELAQAKGADVPATEGAAIPSLTDTTQEAEAGASPTRTSKRVKEAKEAATLAMELAAAETVVEDSPIPAKPKAAKTAAKEKTPSPRGSASKKLSAREVEKLTPGTGSWTPKEEQAFAQGIVLYGWGQWRPMESMIKVSIRLVWL